MMSTGFNNRGPKVRWTKQEKQFLFEYWPGKTKEEKEAIYAFLDRHSREAVRCEAFRLGLCKSQIDPKEADRRREAMWTALEEVEGGVTVAQLAALTGWARRYVLKELWALRDANRAHPLPTPPGAPKVWTAGRLDRIRATTEATMTKLRANIGNPFAGLM